MKSAGAQSYSGHAGARGGNVQRSVGWERSRVVLLVPVRAGRFDILGHIDGKRKEQHNECDDDGGLPPVVHEEPRARRRPRDERAVQHNRLEILMLLEPLPLAFACKLEVCVKPLEKLAANSSHAGQKKTGEPAKCRLK